VTLNTAAHVTWYKEIKAFNQSLNPLGWIAAQDSAHGPVTMQLTTADVRFLVFTKAKAFGIHTGMYEVSGFGDKNGAALNFNWAQD